MRKRLISLSVLTFTIICISCKFYPSIKIDNLSKYVDPIIGTDYTGHTHPSACLPFGMIQVGPDTKTEGWDGCSGYHYKDSIIYGFTHTHLSGTGCSDYGDILLLPIHRYDNDISKTKHFAPFSHKNELAQAGYYSVLLDNSNIKVELTATKRAGMHKYEFPDETNNYIILDLEHRDYINDAYIKQVSDTRIVGLRSSKSWAKNQILYFAIDFSHAVEFLDFSGQKEINDEKIKISALDGKCKLVLKPINKTKFINLKVGISSVNEQGAIMNLEKEMPDFDFDKYKEQATNEWNKELSKILISCDSEEKKRIFYTALYHAFSVPNIYNDIDGSYRGTDLEVHKSPDKDIYTVFSLWDTYRAAHPLYTITQEKKTLDFINTFLEQYKNGGELPMWELSANETYCMIGYHSIPVIVDAYMKGIRDFDHELALEAMIKTAKEDRLGKTEYNKFGYIPLDLEHESVSKCLEYAFDDWCIAIFAKELGNDSVYKEFMERAQFYKNTFNPENGFMQARINSAWQVPFNPKEVNFNYTEANSWQYSFYAPHDILSFIEMHGGDKNFEAKIDKMFEETSQTTGTDQLDITGLIGQYAHGNEPSHHIAYLYNYCKLPWKTQKIVRQIMSELYTDKPDGLCGNEDCGQMSAWYILSSLGFYSTNPCNGIYDIGSPIFDTAIIQLENGKSFTIIAHNNSDENVYIKDIKLNGQYYHKLYITHKDIIEGGKIEFFMSNEAQTNRIIKSEHIFDSSISEQIITPTPYTSNPNKSFLDSTFIEIDCLDKDAVIYYSLNDENISNPTRYSAPILLKESTKIYAYAISEGKLKSKTINAEYLHIKEPREIKILSSYSPQYSAGGDKALIDMIKGGKWFRSGSWQGYFAQDFVAIVDLLDKKSIDTINTSFIQDTRSWVFFPKKVTYYTSDDGINFKKLGEIISSMPDNKEDIEIQNFTYSNKTKGRYIKVVSENYGKLPEWHISVGNDSWLFIDEIEIICKD